jgi:hypothetical protein
MQYIQASYYPWHSDSRCYLPCNPAAKYVADMEEDS